jgi:hypothetical protein
MDRLAFTPNDIVAYPGVNNATDIVEIAKHVQELLFREPVAIGQ